MRSKLELLILCRLGMGSLKNISGIGHCILEWEFETDTKNNFNIIKIQQHFIVNNNAIYSYVINVLVLF